MVFQSNKLKRGNFWWFKEIVSSVEGEDVYGSLNLKLEPIGFRECQKQKPKVEFTPAATVAVLPEAEDVELEINTADIRKDTFRASGAGGQHVNKTGLQ